VTIEDWYEGQREGLGGEFREAVDAASRGSASIRSPIRSATEDFAELCCDDFRMSYGIGRFRTPWSSWRASTAVATLVRSVRDFAVARTSKGPATAVPGSLSVSLPTA
jgi:hypothetical protein